MTLKRNVDVFFSHTRNLIHISTSSQTRSYILF